MAQFENGFALLIGVDENNLQQWSLPEVSKDIAAMEQVLIHPERCAYPPEQIKKVTGKNATRQGILDGLDWLKEQLQRDQSGNATAIIHYSGHGWRDKKQQPPSYYLIPYDIRRDNIRSRALRAEDFADAIKAMAPRRLLVILDCCHAAGMNIKDIQQSSDFIESAVPTGMLMTGERAVPAAEGIRRLEALEKGYGRAVLSSSLGEHPSYNRRDGKMGIFTYHLIEALTGHARHQSVSEEVLVSDVMSHVWRLVPQSAQADWGKDQQPDFQVSGNFPIALLLGGKGLKGGQPPPDPLEMTPKTEAGKSYTISTGGGDYIGRDKFVRGDEIHGDKVLGDKIIADKIIFAEGSDEGIGNSKKDYPFQLPPRTENFVGRKEDLRIILESIKPREVITLWGPGGIGKTALAIEAIWILEEKGNFFHLFPDGLIFYSYYDQPVTEFALKHLVQSFDKSVHVVSLDVASRVLSNKRALILLDGAEEADNLHSILSVLGNCGVLITTRSRKDSHASIQSIEPLSTDEAIRLLNIWGKNQIDSQDAAESICEMVGRIPLAVRLAGRYLYHSGTRATEYLNWLRETTLEALNHGARRVESIPVLVERCLGQISLDAKKVLAVCSILGLAPFNRKVITSAFERQEFEILRWFGELVNYGFLIRLDEEYKISHVLIQNYVRNHIEVEEKTLEQLINYFIELAENNKKLGYDGYYEMDQNRIHIMRLIVSIVSSDQDRHKKEVERLIRSIGWYLKPILFIPETAGFISDKDGIFASTNRKIFYISDVSGNVSAQKSIVDIIYFLIKQWKIKLVMVEGGEKNVSLRYIRKWFGKEKSKDYAQEEFNSGHISGAEYLSIVTEKPLILYGIDNNALYSKAYQEFQNTLEIRSNLITKNINDRQIDLLQRKLLPNNLLALEELNRKFEESEIAFTDFILKLTSYAQQYKIELKAYPNISLSLASAHLENNFSLKKLPIEASNLNTLIRKYGQEADTDLLEVFNSSMRLNIINESKNYQLLASLMEKYGFSTEEFINLRQYNEYSQFMEKFEPRLLLTEISELIDALVKELAASQDELQMLTILRLIKISWKIVNRKAYPNEYLFFRQNQYNILEKIEPIEKFFQKSESLIKPQDLYSLITGAVKCSLLYEAVIERAAVIANNIRETMDNLGEMNAVLITSGFLTPYVKQYLKYRDEDIVNITPLIQEPTDDDKYISLMKRNRSISQGEIWGLISTK